MMEKLKGVWARRRGTVVACGVVLVGVGGMAGVRMARSAPNVPTEVVKQEDFIEYVQLRGEVKAQKSKVLTAPSNAGDLQILKLVKTGTMVKKGDIIAQFDATPQQRTLEQKQTELKQAEAEIERMKAQKRLLEEQNQTEVEKSGYDIERARLETTKQEILSTIEGEKNKLTLNNAEQKLKEVTQKAKSDVIGSDADIESRRQRREKTLFEVRQAEQRIAALTLKAPVDGMATLLPNFRAGGMFNSTAPEFKEGDRAWSGAAIAELPDLSTILVSARIDETDRGRLKAGQGATARVDAVPDKELAGSVLEISPLAKLDYSGWPVTKNFDLTVKLEKPDARLRPGMSASARVAVDRLPNALVIPAEAVFRKGGRTVAYVLRSRGLGWGFEEREVEVAKRDTARVAISKGLKAGEKVALKDPTVKEEPGEKP